MTDKKRINPALLALTASALGLPGIARAQAPEELQLDYRYSAYSEDDISGGKTASGNSSERYEIDTHQFRIARPISDEIELAADLTYESMSGASPWFITPDASNNPVQVMSGASIEEKRADILLSAKRKLKQGSGTVSFGYSDEDDYKALNLGAQAEWQLNDTVSTISGGVGYSDDDLEPTDGVTPVSVTSESRDAVTVFGGYARVLDENTVIQTGLGYTEHSGFLSDPYKQAFFVSLAGTRADSRPDGRRQWAWQTRLRRYFAGPDAALHLDYRFYDDDWDVTSHTVDVAWHQNLAQGWKVVPGLRWYSQSQAFFYEPFYAAPRSDGFASSDYRLSPFGALGLSIAANKEINGWTLGLRYENYTSGEKYAVDEVDVENPGLVDFDIFSFSVKKAF